VGSSVLAKRKNKMERHGFVLFTWIAATLDQVGRCRGAPIRLRHDGAIAIT
jgi:hypothetical protein